MPIGRRTTLLALAGLVLGEPPAAVGAEGARPGERVDWPRQVTLLDGRAWQPTPGHATIVVFWSTTCPFCKRHNPHVEKLHRQLQGRRADVLGVARDRDGEAVRRHMAREGLTFPVTLEYAALADSLSRRNVIPLTVTVDRAGRLRELIPGEMFEEDVLELARLADGQ